MYILEGKQKFIFPEQTKKNTAEQIDDCLNKSLNLYSSDAIYKFNFFINTQEDNSYLEAYKYITQKINNLFSEKPLVNVIAQAPLNGQVIAEVFTYNPQKWEKHSVSYQQGKAFVFNSEGTSFLFGSAQENQEIGCLQKAEKCFETVDKLLSSASFSTTNIIRQWNYIQNILSTTNNTQNYQIFNNVRSYFYGQNFQKNGYPAATGIGISAGGILIDFIAMKSDKTTSLAIDNPKQQSAHLYSKKVLIELPETTETPKFERARLLKNKMNQFLFISGTAAILGEKTIGVNDPEKQTEITISNIKKLLEDKQLDKKPNITNYRIYIKTPDHYNNIKKICTHLLGDIPSIFVLSDICRDNLLVEIEGEAISF